LELSGGDEQALSAPAVPAAPAPPARQRSDVVYRLHLGSRVPSDNGLDFRGPVTWNPLAGEVESERFAAPAPVVVNPGTTLAARRRAVFLSGPPPSRATRFEGLRISRPARLPDLVPSVCPFGTGGTEEDTYGAR
jgi:hypothetical protein